MKRPSLLILTLAGILLILGSCTNETPTGPTPGLGGTTVTKYVAIGNSLTAGYQSNALYESAQRYSFPHLIKQQLERAGASLGSFEQPLYGDPGNADPSTGKAARLEILSLSGPVPTIGPSGVNPGAPTNTALTRPYDNLGIPGIPLASFLDTTNFLSNPFVDLVLRSAGGFPKSMFEQVVLLQPDLITFWLGNNDILGYATSGGTSPAAPTPAGIFTALYMQAIDTLRDVLPGTKILLGNIPDVTSIPFFTTVGPLAQAQGITALWGIRSTGDTVLMSLSANLLTLSAQDELGSAKGFARMNPISNAVVLDSTEILTARNATNAYNAAIAAAAAAFNAVVFDANALLKRVNEEGYSVAGEVYSSAYVAGGLFSLDGVHPSSRGYAIVANEMLKVLNGTYGMNIPLADVSSIPGIPAPMGKRPFGPVLAKGALENFHRIFSTESHP